MAPEKTSGATDMARNTGRVTRSPATHSTSDTAITITMVWAATRLTMGRLRAPLNCATRIKPAVESPLPSTTSINVSGVVTETTAMAVALNRPNQNALTSW